MDFLDYRQLRLRLYLLPARTLSDLVSLYLLHHTGSYRIIYMEKERNKKK